MIGPLFPHEMWSVRDRVLEGFERTNNAKEGWHNRMRRPMENAKNRTIKMLVVIQHPRRQGLQVRLRRLRSFPDP